MHIILVIRDCAQVYTVYFCAYFQEVFYVQLQRLLPSEPH